MSNLQKVLIITGMHRSGTSLLASWLEQAGLDIGEKLLSANVSNPKGYFEDLDFFNFHRNVLSENHVHHFPRRKPAFTIQDDYLKQAEQLILHKNGKSQFGFKDPRTTLFLENIWEKVIPEAKAIFIFRHPNAVIHSLLRRELLAQTKPWQKVKWKIARRILRKRFEYAYRLYNSAILEYCERHPEKVILLELDALEKQAPPALVKLTQQGFNLKKTSLDSIIQKDLLHQNNTLKPFKLKKETELLYQKLKELAPKTLLP